MIDLKEAIKVVNKKSSLSESLKTSESIEKSKVTEEPTLDDKLKIVKYYFKDDIINLGKYYYEEEKLNGEEYSNESLKIIERFENEILHSNLDDWDFTTYMFKSNDIIEPLHLIKNSGKEAMIDAKGGIVELDFVKFNNGHFGVINHSDNIIYELLQETQYEESLGRPFKDMKITSKKRLKESMDIEEFATRLSNVLYDYDNYTFRDACDSIEDCTETSLEWYKENPKDFKRKAKEDLENITIEDADLADEHYEKIKKEKEILLKEVDNLKEEKISTKNVLDNKESKKELKEDFDRYAIYTYFDHAADSMIDLVMDLLERFELNIEPGQDIQDILDRTLDEGFIYEWQYWEIMQHYQLARDANFEEAYYEFYDDMFNLVSELFEGNLQENEDELEESKKEIKESKLTEAKVYQLFAHKVDSNGKQIPGTEIKIENEYGYDRKELSKKAEEYESSWNVNPQGDIWKVVVRHIYTDTEKPLKESIRGVSFDFKDIEEIRDKIANFEYSDIVEISDKPNKYGIGTIWIDTNGFDTNEEKQVESFIQSIVNKYSKNKNVTEASNGKNFRKVYGNDGTVFTQTYRITKSEYQKVLDRLEAEKPIAYLGDIVHGSYEYMKKALTNLVGENKNVIEPNLKSAAFIADTLKLDNFKKDRNVRFIVENLNTLSESPEYKLEPKYDSRKSFYGKAAVDSEDGVETLYSYGTKVAEIRNHEVTLFPAWDASQTTLRHVKEFLKQFGFEASSIHQMRKDYIQK